jgi:two-component system sensor histidine kinase HydH
MSEPIDPRSTAVDASDSTLHPLALALLLSLLYVLLLGAYIVFSGIIAAGLSESVHELERMETAKGLIFVLSTGALFFALSFAVLRRISMQEIRVIGQKNALLESERRAMVGIFAASIAHDIANILVVARGSLRSMEDELRNEREKSDAIATLRRSLEELKVLTRRLVSIEHDRIPNEVTDFELDQLVRDVVALARSHLNVRGCSLRVTANDPVTIHGNRSMLAMMLLNLILNAAGATQGRGRIDVMLRRGDAEAVLEVHDDGPGVPASLRAAIFDAFYSSKAHGTGLGLLTVKVCAEEHGGQVAVGDSELGGACFRVTLPRERQSAPGALE